MKELNKEELFSVIGGISLSGSLIKSFTSMISIVLDIGRSLGTAFRRTFGNNICQIK